MRGIEEKAWVDGGGDGDGSDGLGLESWFRWLEIWTLMILRDQVFRVSLSTRSPMTWLAPLFYIIILSKEAIEHVHSTIGDF